MTKNQLRSSHEPTNGGNLVRRRLNAKAPMENGQAYETITTAPSPSKSSDPNRVSERMSHIFHRMKKMDSASRLRLMDFMESVLRKRRTITPVDDASLVRRLRRKYGSLEVSRDLSDVEYNVFLRNEIEMDDRARCFMRENVPATTHSLASAGQTPSYDDDTMDYDSTVTDPYSLCFAEQKLLTDPFHGTMTDHNKADDSDDSYDPLIESPVSNHRASSSNANPSSTFSPSSCRPVLKARVVARDDPSLFGQIIYPARVISRPGEGTEWREGEDIGKVGSDNYGEFAAATRPVNPIKGMKHSIGGAVLEETQKRNGRYFESSLKTQVKLETDSVFTSLTPTTSYGCEDDPIEIASSGESDISELPNADTVISIHADVNDDAGCSTILNASRGSDVQPAQEPNMSCSTAQSTCAPKKKKRKPKKTTYVEYLIQRNAAANAKALAEKAAAKEADALEKRRTNDDRAPSSASTIGITDRAQRREKRPRRNAALRPSVNGATRSALTMSGST